MNLTKGQVPIGVACGAAGVLLTLAARWFANVGAVEQNTKDLETLTKHFEETVGSIRFDIQTERSARLAEQEKATGKLGQLTVNVELLLRAATDLKDSVAKTTDNVNKLAIGQATQQAILDQLVRERK